MIPLYEILVVGESTNQGGPYVDDWFLSVAVSDGWFDIPVYSEGFDSFLEDLAGALGVSLELRLVNSTSFRSRVLWPPELSAEDMFKYTRVWYRFSMDQHYTEPVKRAIGALSERSASARPGEN